MKTFNSLFDRFDALTVRNLILCKGGLLARVRYVHLRLHSLLKCSRTMLAFQKAVLPSYGVYNNVASIIDSISWGTSEGHCIDLDYVALIVFEK